jgi:quercetin dioxygenase-like cupin family protein
MTDNTPAQTTEDDKRLATERKARMRSRLLERAGRDMAVVRGEQQGWQQFLPGVDLKVLHVDRAEGMQTALWRLAPGARIPGHPHSRDEECYVLEGSLEHRGECYRAGDYMLAPAGSRHGSITSAEGVLMLIRGEQVNWRERLLLRASLALGR